MAEIVKNIILENDFQQVIEINNFYYFVDKKDRLAVLPYVISSNGLLDKVGVVEDFNYVDNCKTLTVINGYINTDDDTNLTVANRLLFETLKQNVSNAIKWMYLGNLNSNITSDSPIKLYAVDISDLQLTLDEENLETKDDLKFKLMDVNKILQTNDMMFLASYLRLFEFFYVNSLSKKEDETK